MYTRFSGKVRDFFDDFKSDDIRNNPWFHFHLRNRPIKDMTRNLIREKESSLIRCASSGLIRGKGSTRLCYRLQKWYIQQHVKLKWQQMQCRIISIHKLLHSNHKQGLALFKSLQGSLWNARKGVISRSAGLPVSK